MNLETIARKKYGSVNALYVYFKKHKKHISRTCTYSIVHEGRTDITIKMAKVVMDALDIKSWDRFMRLLNEQSHSN